MCTKLRCSYVQIEAFPGGSVAKKKKKNPSANAGDLGSIPKSGRSPGEVNGNPLRYSCLGNGMTEEPGGLQSVKLQRVGHDLRD